MVQTTLAKVDPNITLDTLSCDKPMTDSGHQPNTLSVIVFHQSKLFGLSKLGRASKWKWHFSLDAIMCGFYIGVLHKIILYKAQYIVGVMKVYYSSVLKLWCLGQIN